MVWKKLFRSGQARLTRDSWPRGFAAQIGRLCDAGVRTVVPTELLDDLSAAAAQLHPADSWRADAQVVNIWLKDKLAAKADSYRLHQGDMHLLRAVALLEEAFRTSSAPERLRLMTKSLDVADEARLYKPEVPGADILHIRLAHTMKGRRFDD